MPKTNEPPKEQSFETAMTRLEHIVAEMESDKLPLEQLLVHYEEGAKLVKSCQAKLVDFERKIEIIQARADGTAETKPFEPETRPEPPPKAKKDVSLF
jgi:exodeoxyribonuclease VII small subunit